MLRLIKEELPFRELTEIDNLYDDEDLVSNVIVDAQYMRRPGYEDSPDVCALPRTFTSEDILNAFDSHIGGLNAAERGRMDIAARLDAISDLRQVCVPLGIHLDIAQAISEALLSSYRARGAWLSDVSSMDIVPGEIGCSCVSHKRPRRIKAGGFTMIGEPGCGKTVGVELVTSLYPKAIRHRLESVEYIQIPIIMVTVKVNSLSSVLNGIAQELDRILDTGDFHESKIRHKQLSSATSLIERWVSVYHVGLVILDEIQFLAFDDRRTSFENIVSIAEETGLAWGLIGNRDRNGYKNMARIVRRVMGNELTVSMTDNDKKLFESAVRTLWDHQLGEGQAVLTDTIKNYIMTQTAYNIALLKAFMMALYRESVKKKATITMDMVRDVYEAKFTEAKALITKGTVEADKALTDILQRSADELDADREKARNNDKARAAIAASKRTAAVKKRIDEATEHLMAAYGRDYTEKQIRRAVDKGVDNIPYIDEAPVEAIVTEAEDLLKKAKKRAALKAPGGPSPDTARDRTEDSVREVISRVVS